MARAIEILKQEHRDMEKLLRALERQLANFDEGGPVDYDIMEAVVDYSFAYPDLCHHPVEDAIFELVERRKPGALSSRVDLAAEHKKLADLTRKLASLLDSVVQETPTPREWLEKTARDYIDFTRHHMDMEEKYFFPVAETALNDDDWQEIEARLASEDDPLFSPRARDRFSRLREDILSWESSGAATQRSNA